MTLSEDFDAFMINVVQLNEGRLNRLQGHVDSLETFISEDDIFSDLFRDVIPAGSWAHGTIIKPVDSNDEFDADLLVYLNEHDEWSPKDYIENLYSRFMNNGNYSDKVSRKTRCLRVNYAGDFHVDLVPYLERPTGHFITNRSEPQEEGRYELSNPEGFNEWMEGKDRATSGHFREIIQLLKYLRDYKNTFTCKSIILTTLTGNAVNSIEAALFPQNFVDLPTAFVWVLERLSQSLPATMPAVLDPAGTGDNFSDRYADDWNYENFRTRISGYASSAREALDETDTDSSAALWQGIFGTDFRREPRVAAAGLSLRSDDRGPDEKFIDEPPFGFPIRIDDSVKVKLTGRCTGFTIQGIQKKNGFRQFDLPRNGNRVGKKRSLRFQVKTDAVAPYEIYWKVRNRGQEALDAGQLRGEITEGWSCPAS